MCVVSQLRHSFTPLGLNFSDMAPVVGDKNQSSPGSEGSSNGSDGGGSKVSSVSRGSQGSLERALCISGML